MAPPQPSSPPLPPPDTPDEVLLTPAEALVALERAKNAKWGTLYRAYHLWRLSNCDLVPDGPNGELAYALKEGPNVQPEPYLPAAATDVELTPTEQADALRAGQERKWSDLKAAYHLYQQKHAPRVSAGPAGPVGVAQVWDWALQQAAAVASRRNPPFFFALDEHNTRVFELLCYYHAGDTEFERLGQEWGFGPLSLSKGIGLFGGVGVGKTILSETFRQSPQRPYGLVTAQKVSDVFGQDLTANEGKRSVVSSAQLLYCGQEGKALCFDDVGSELPRKHQHMGNTVVPLQKALLARYNAVQKGRLPLWATHLTSNHPLEPTHESRASGVPALSELYDDRVADRLYELCNIIPLHGPSRRA